ncbi:YneF family protein [Malacoplasma muris]|uniref:YneF family protein n=1 Tax=Malacoplasma muris TaxID=2119 RepID=UPI00398F61CF
MVSSLALILSLSIGIPLAIIAGAILGYFLAMKYFKKQLKDNPPITEAQIRSMYQQMGRKPTEKQIKQIMATFKKNAK